MSALDPRDSSASGPGSPPPVATSPRQPDSACPSPAASARWGAFSRQWLLGLLALGLTLTVLTAALTAWLVIRLSGRDALPQAGMPGLPPSAHAPPLAITVVRPKWDARTLTLPQPISVVCPVTIRPAQTAELVSRVSGVVRFVRGEVGDRVRRGEVLIEIDAPDVVEEAAVKGALVGQRQRELDYALAQRPDVELRRRIAEASVREKRALLEQAEATRDFRFKRLQRLKHLVARESIVPGLLDEEERDLVAGEAGVKAARAAVEKSEAEAEDAQSQVTAFQAEIALKQALVEVARREAARAAAIAQFTRLTAPFDAIIRQKTVEPGQFVTAASASPPPLMQLARADWWTATANLPTTWNAELHALATAELMIDSYGDLPIPVRVAPGLSQAANATRWTTHLYSGGEARWRSLLTDSAAERLLPLAAASPWTGLVSQVIAEASTKSRGLPDALADVPRWPADRPIPPGPTGRLTLRLTRLGPGYLLPRTAIDRGPSGTFIRVVEQGVTRSVPVQVLSEDGSSARVLMVESGIREGPTPRETPGPVGLRELTGDEQVVREGSPAVEAGRAVVAVLRDW